MANGDGGFETFVHALSELPDSDLLRLRRAAGRPRGADLELDDIFNTIWRKLRETSGAVQRGREQCFLVAKLYPWNLRRPERGKHPPGDLGVGFRLVLAKHAGNTKTQARIERRFLALLDSTGAALEAALLDAVRMLGSEDVPVNWTRLLSDLADWDMPGRPVQDRWYRVFRGHATATTKGA
jgi:CRISPR type I-E-associated protein CasB/Cse2